MGGSPELHSAIAYIHLQAGNLDSATVHLEVANLDPSLDPYIRTLNSVLRAVAYGEWDYAQRVLEASIDTASEDVQQVIVSGRITGCDKALLLMDCDYVTECKQYGRNLAQPGKTGRSKLTDHHPEPHSRTLSQAIARLEKATFNFPSTAVIAEPFLFNLGLLTFTPFVCQLLSDFSGVSDAL